MCATASCATVFVSAGGPRARPGVVIPAEAAASPRTTRRRVAARRGLADRGGPARRGGGGRQEERPADGDRIAWSAGGPKTLQGYWPRTAGTPRRGPPKRTAGSLARTGSCPPGTQPGGEADAGGTGRSLRNKRPMPGTT